MNPIETLQDIYNQIAAIKEWVCNNEGSSEEKNTILSLPRFSLEGIEGTIHLQTEDNFAQRVRLALQDIFYFHAIKDTHGRFSKIANQRLVVYEKFANIELPVSLIRNILVDILQSLLLIDTTFREWNYIDLGIANGSREIDLSNEVEYVSIDILEYPAWVERQFYYIPFTEEITISESLKGFFFSTVFEGFLEYRVSILSSKSVLKKPSEADKFYLYALQQFKSRIKLWRRFDYE